MAKIEGNLKKKISSEMKVALRFKPFQTLLDPFGPLWNDDKPAMSGHFCLFYWCNFFGDILPIVHALILAMSSEHLLFRIINHNILNTHLINHFLCLDRGIFLVGCKSRHDHTVGALGQQQDLPLLRLHQHRHPLPGAGELNQCEELIDHLQVLVLPQSLTGNVNKTEGERIFPEGQEKSRTYRVTIPICNLDALWGS